MDKSAESNEIRFVARACLEIPQVHADWVLHSLSLDESNDLRAKLGLAPLRAKKEVQQGDSAAAYRSRDELAAAEAKREQLQARLSSAKRAREAAAAEESSATSTVHGAASDWVASMRQRKAARKAAPAATSKGKAAPAVRAAPLQLGSEDQDDFEGGIAVRHGVGDFQEGQSVVLTLADADVLGDEGDVLQNSQLLEGAKAALANQRKDKLAKSRGGSSYSRAGGDSSGGMLSRWEEGDAAAVTGTQAVLTASGALVPSLVKGGADSTTDSAAADAVRDRLHAAAAQGVVRMADDFMTPEEAAAAMPAPRKGKGKTAKAKKHKRSKRSRAVIAEDDASAVSGGFFQGAEGSLGGGGGAGAAMAAALMASAGEPIHANAATSTSVANVSAAKAKLLAAPAGDGGGVNPLTKQRTYRRSAAAAAASDEDDAGDDWSVQLTSSLARAKAVTSSGPAVPAAAPAASGAGGSAAAAEADVDVAAVAERLAAARAARDAVKAQSAAAASPGGAGALVFSSTDEFKRRMEAARASSRPAAPAAGAALQDSREGETQGEDARGLEAQLADAEAHVAAATADGSLTAEEGGTGGGAASALDFLRRTGALKPVKSRAQIAGRANDKLMEEGDDPAPGIQLKYHDAFGREMTTKEAFRHLNYKFHGYGSGKGKRDKKLKAYMDSVQASKKG